ncbi:MAG TPA: radical SAM protein, partial [Verrucomicrobiae bacterium]|nr:radical SAM protein [Verrucomicrobiae bacterium]
QRRFRYFGKEECALVKTAWGCGFECSFCYCARLNGGKYQVRNMPKVIEEIAALPQKRIFIIDDNFLAAKARVLEFCNLIQAHQIQKNFSVYGRADFICANAAILPRLREAGIDEVIVGLESIDDKTLQSYNKQVSADTNLQAVKLLHEHGISTCGLFIVGQDYGVEDFRQLARTVKQMKLANCMFSIFTPLKGVPGYEDYQERLVSPPDFFENLDFLHLTLRPGKLNVARFYFEFYRLYAVAYLDWYRIKHNALPLLRSLKNLALENIKGFLSGQGQQKNFGG